MAFPRKLLAEHEDLVLDLRPHWIALVLPTTIGVAVLAGSIVLWETFDSGRAVNNSIRWVTVIAAAIILLGFVVRPIVAWYTDNFVVTSDRLIHRRGLIAKHSMEIPLEAINDVRFSQGVVGRVIGEGTLTIHSAAEASAQRFAHIRNPEAVQKTIYEVGEQNRVRMGTAGTMGGETPSGPGAPATPSVADEIRKLNGLRAEGVISEEEFEAHKRRLLGVPTDPAPATPTPTETPSQAPPRVDPPAAT